MHTVEPYQIMDTKSFLSPKAGFWLFIFLGIIFQLSGGVYFSLAEDMVGERKFIHEDVMFAGYASLVGMTMIFPALFSLKFRFAARNLLITCALILIVCNLIVMNTNYLPLLVVISFIAGIFKMIAFFECVSILQLKISPTRDFAIFIPFVFFFVLGIIQLSGITTGYITYFFRWEYMHLLVIGLLLIAILCCIFLLRPFCPASPPVPLQNIDWFGAFLWSFWLMLLIFILEYGEYYDWLDSKYIRIAIVCSILIMIYLIQRTGKLKHSYITSLAFKHHNVSVVLFLFLVMIILLSTPHILQNIFTNNILKYDSLTTASLNWAIFVGIVAGVYFSYVAIAKKDWGYTFVTSIGFALILGYLIGMYFLISPATKKEYLYVPLFLQGAGNAIVYNALTVYIVRNVPFHYRFQVLALLGFVRTGVASPMGTAILGNFFSVIIKKNIMLLGGEIDPQNPLLNKLGFNAIMEELQRQSIMVSAKEIFGYASMGGVLILILALSTRYKKLLKFKMLRW